MASKKKKVLEWPKDVVYYAFEGVSLDTKVLVGLTFYLDSNDNLLAVDFWLDSSRDDIDPKELNVLWKLYTIGSQIRLSPLAPQEKPSIPSSGCVAIMVVALKAGVPFPLSDFVSQCLVHFGIALGQLSPNSYRHLIGLRVPFTHRNWPEVTPEQLLWIYCLRKAKGDTEVYLLRPRYGKAIIAGVPNSEKDWR